LLTAFAINKIKPIFLREEKLGQLNKIDVYCAELPIDYILPAEFEAVSLRHALELLGIAWYEMIAKGSMVIQWDKNHQYCGRCAHQTIQTTGHFERICPACKLNFYPRISPSIIVRIQKDDEILMARGHHFIPGAYGLIAGFVEPGETTEDAVHREVTEEISIKIKNLAYFGSQSWPFPDSLVIAFTADYASGEILIDSTEIEEAGWYRYDQLPGRPSSSISIARKLIDDFVVKKTAK